VLSTVFAVVVALTFSADLNRRLGRLALGANKIGEGDYEHQIPIARADELGTLASAFNAMALRLRDALQREAEARQAAEKANQAKSSFLANMSHELRTPLNAILGYTEMLAEEADELGQKNFLPDLQRIKSAGTHLLTLINEVLDLSKIEAGKMTLLIEPIDVPELVEEVIATVGPLAQKNSNELRLEVRGEPGELHADATKLRQTLFNLLSNASKFTTHGAITLRAWEDRSQQLFHFEVEDTGIGMTDTQLSRVFDEFTQAELTTAKKYGGTGLGLSISRKFARLMGGDLNASSRSGRGSTFHLVLPAVVDSSPEAVTSASPPPG
jgi:signal transduction histidine kinase